MRKWRKMPSFQRILMCNSHTEQELVAASKIRTLVSAQMNRMTEWNSLCDDRCVFFHLFSLWIAKMTCFRRLEIETDLRKRETQQEAEWTCQKQKKQKPRMITTIFDWKCENQQTTNKKPSKKPTILSPFRSSGWKNKKIRKLQIRFLHQWNPHHQHIQAITED